MIDLLFQVRFCIFNPRFSLGLSVVIRHIHAQLWWENALENQFREEKSIYI